MTDARGRVARVLTSEIADARLVPHDALPHAEELADTLNVAPAVVREVVGQLAAWGLVTVGGDGRAVVNPEARWDVLNPGVVDILLESEHGPAIVAEYLEARCAFETIAAGLAAERATTDDLTALSEAFERMSEARAESEFHGADVDFHGALVAATHNRVLRVVTGPLQPALCVARRALARPGLRRERGLPEHRRILAAVAQGDAEAARQAMADHLDTVDSYLREYAGLAGSNAE